MSQNPDFLLVFAELKSILEPYAAEFTLKHNLPGHYYLDGPYSHKWKKELFFASTQIRRNYVSYYLMPVYMYPELTARLSPALKRHMQGKSCFNFKKVEAGLFQELQDLTRRAAECFRKEFAP